LYIILITMTPEEKEAACAEDVVDDRRYYHWVFTVNNPTEDDEHRVFALAEDCKFVSVGAEHGSIENTPHLQGFASFTTLKSFEQLKELLPRAWLAVKSKRSTFAQAIDYTQKDGDFWEHGTRPSDPADKGAREKEFWLEQLDCVRKRKYGDMDPKVKALHLSKLKYAIAVEDEETTEGIKSLAGPRQVHEWHWGVHHSGKSDHCRREHTAPESVYTWDFTGKYWDQYKFQSIVHLEDVDETQKPSQRVLKRLADKYKYTITRRYFPDVDIRPDQIMVSSQVHPKDCYKGVHLAAILDRFKIYHWPIRYGDPGWFNPTLVDAPPHV